MSTCTAAAGTEFQYQYLPSSPFIFLSSSPTGSASVIESFISVFVVGPGCYYPTARTCSESVIGASVGLRVPTHCIPSSMAIEVLFSQPKLTVTDLARSIL